MPTAHGIAGPCPPPDELQAFSSGDGDLERRRAITEHLLRCPNCIADLKRRHWSPPPGSDLAELAVYLEPECRKLVEGAKALPVETDDQEASLPTPGDSGLRESGTAADSQTTRVRSEPSSEPVPRLGDFPDRYEMRRLLGRGGFGEVYEAFDRELHRDVAVKLLREDRLGGENIRLFREEARKLASVTHRAVVQVYDVGRTGHRWYIVTELVRGGTLMQRIQDSPSFSPAEAARMLAEIAEGLHQAHRRGIVHRDIKPSNILLDATGQPRLTDFGIAATEEEQLAEPSGQVGTLPYMSPEQIRGDSRFADARSDVYALGNVLYLMLTGRLPFLAQSKEQYHDQICHRPPRPLRTLRDDVPAELERICLKCLEKSPTARYTTADDLAKDLRATLPGANPRRRLFQAASIVALGVLGAALVAIAGVHFEIWGVKVETTVRHQVVVNTEPEGATVVLYQLDRESRLPVTRIQPDKVTPVTVNLEPGDYLVVAVLGDRFHEVYRRVPIEPKSVGFLVKHKSWTLREDGMVEWPAVKLPQKDPAATMAHFKGSRGFLIGSPTDTTIPQHRQSVPSFYLDTQEVTLAEYRAWAGGGRLAPLLEAGNKSRLPNDSIVGLMWDDAVAHAERCGKRLPTEFEYEFAATYGGTRTHPWGNTGPLGEWPFLPAGSPAADVVPVIPPVFGLGSNVAEWTDSRSLPYPPAHRGAMRTVGPIDGDYESHFIVRGGTHDVVVADTKAGLWRQWTPRFRNSYPILTMQPGLGFRCARSAKQRLTLDDFGRVVDDE